MIYFDSAASSRPSEAARDAFIYADSYFANPSSVHSAGISANDLISVARKEIAKSVGAKPNNIYFVPSGTFANNTAILGSVQNYAKRGKHIIISDSEHPAVENVCAVLEKSGYRITRLSTKSGKINIDDLKNALYPETVLVSIMAANNETGALYDIPSIASAIKSYNKDILFHSDCVQAYMKVPINVNTFGPDMISVSAHKVHGYKGIGALYVSDKVRLSPIIYGGGQENGMCSGTQATGLIYSFAKAVSEESKLIASAKEHVCRLYNYVSENLVKCGCSINTPENSTYYVLSVVLPSIKSEVMLNYLSGKDIYISAGSACSSHSKTNRVLSSFGLSPKEADCTVRISFDRYNTLDEAQILVESIKEGIGTLAKIK